MVYFSTLIGSRVRDAADETAGKLVDVLAVSKSSGYAALSYLKIQSAKENKIIYLPFESVANLSPKLISLKGTLAKINQDDELWGDYINLQTDVLDQQIVDLTGVRVVRVNDLRLGYVEGQMCVLGIDVSFKGLLRRLGLEWLDLFDLLKANFIDWRQAKLVKGHLKLDTSTSDLNTLHPADLANIIEDLNLKQGSQLMKSLDAKSAAQVLEEVEPERQKNIIEYLEPEQAGRILEQMSADEIADLIQELPKSKADKLYQKINKVTADQVKKLAIYEENTAGGLMALDFLTVRPDLTIGQAVEEIKKTVTTLRTVLYVYITESDGQFIGTTSLRRLLVAFAEDPRQSILSLAKKLPPLSTLTPNQSIQEVIEIMTKYNLFTVAVVDESGKLVGVVSIDDVMRYLAPQA